MTDPPGGGAGGDEADETALPPDTIAWLEAAASASFRRQEELDESIWRSLPFFAATLGLALTILGHLAERAPLPEWSIYPAAINGLLAATALSFAWAFRWFWSIVHPRTYEYPAADAEVQRFARQLTAFHDGAGLAPAEMDQAVLLDLRQFSMEQLGEAARRNRLNNRRKLAARNQAMFFTLLAFVLAFACGLLIFIHDALQRSVDRTGNGHVAASRHLS